MDAKIKYYLEIADNALILSHRLAENCSRGPFLEEDLAGTNVALDLIGFAESIYEEAAKLKGDGSCGDDIAYRRSEWEYYNTLLAEQPNTDFAYIMVRQFFLDSFNYYFLSELAQSSDKFLSEVATKSLKEVTYHLRRSSEWMIRFGNGTMVSRKKAQQAIDDLYPLTGEMFIPSEADKALRDEKISVNLKDVESKWIQKTKELMFLSNLKLPEEVIFQRGGKEGKHSEYLGHMLSEMQYLPSKYPDAKW